jgi:hypothetical protein
MWPDSHMPPPWSCPLLEGGLDWCLTPRRLQQNWTELKLATANFAASHKGAPPPQTGKSSFYKSHYNSNVLGEFTILKTSFVSLCNCSQFETLGATLQEWSSGRFHSREIFFGGKEQVIKSYFKCPRWICISVNPDCVFLVSLMLCVDQQSRH